jgi:hypothetical protein
MTDVSRITLLAGAGLCKDAGLPTSVELAQKLQEALLQASLVITQRTPSQDCDRAKQHLATFRFLNGGIRFQQGILGYDPDQPVNIEQIAVAAEELQRRSLNPLSPYASGWHSRIVELERQSPDLLSTFTDFIYSQLDRWLSLSDDIIGNLHYLRHLFEICNDGCGIDVFSLNYDLCIEAVLTQYLKKQFANGFTEGGGWQPQTLKDDNVIRLFKLHGSLDWVEDQAYGLCSLQYPRHKQAENIEGDNVRPLLIFGTAHKLSPREPFLSLTYSFSQQVLNTTILAIIGYSFGDEHVNQIIRQGIEKNPKLRVLVVGPSAGKQVDSISFLQGRKPRVVDLNAKTQEALTKGEFLKAIRALLERASDEEPFSEKGV